MVARADGTAAFALVGVVAGADAVVAGAVVAVVARLLEVAGGTVENGTVGEARVDGVASVVATSGADGVAAEPAASQPVMPTMAEALAAPTIRRARAAGCRWAEGRGSIDSIMADQAGNSLGAGCPSAGAAPQSELPGTADWAHRVGV